MSYSRTLPGRCKRCGGVIKGGDKDYCKDCLGRPIKKSKRK
jgi:hypothetical protein